MINLQLTEDQTNLMAHILQEMPYKHAAPLMEALRRAVAGRNAATMHPPDAQRAMSAEQSPDRLQAPHAEPVESAPTVRHNPPPKGMRVANS
jgi:hypothetical protein